jgi:hypothetical protein
MASDLESRSARYFKLSCTRGLISNTRGLFGQLLAWLLAFELSQ